MPSDREVARFQWVDYTVFVVTLLLSSCIGIFYAVRDRRGARRTVDNYLLGGRDMHVVPVSVSLFVSWLSAISFLGDPVEVYNYGAVYWILGLGYCLAVPPAAYYFAPRFHRMKLFSAYEFISDRFNYPARVVCFIVKSAVFALYSGIVLYGPAISLAQVSGISVWVSVVGVGLVCTFYTTVGGIKAVLWADTIQAAIMLVGLVALVVRGTIVHGGLAHIWQLAEAKGRINFNKLDPSPFVRSTFWTYLFGGFSRVFNPYISSQAFIQRYSSVKTPTQASWTVYLNFPMYAVSVSLLALLGLILVAHFDGCDPLLAGYIEKQDQMVPLLMIELLGFVPGFAGLFLASLFCASLSSISTAQNSMSLNLLSDVVDPLVMKFTGRTLSPECRLRMSKIFSFSLGFVFMGVALGLISMEDASIFQITIKITGCLLGPIAGLYFTGMLFHFVDSFSAILACLVTLAVSLWWNLAGTFATLRPAAKLTVTAAMCKAHNTSIESVIIDDYTQLESAQHGENWALTTAAANLHESSTAEPLPSYDEGGVYTLYYLSPMVYSTFGFAASVTLSLIFGSIGKLFRRREPSAKTTKTLFMASKDKRGGYYHKHDKKQDWIDIGDIN